MEGKIKVCFMRNGMHVISKMITEFDKDKRPLCFSMTLPFSMIYVEDPETGKSKVDFEAMMPFCNNIEYKIPFGEVITIGDPHQVLLENYVSMIKPYYPIDGGAEPNEIENQGESNNE